MGGTLAIQDTIKITGYLGAGWTYTAGTVDAGTSTVVVATAFTVNSGSMAFNNVILDSTTGMDLTVTGTMDVDGDLTITTIRNVESGTITVAGDLTSTQTGVGNNTGFIILDGANAQSIDINLGDVPDGLFTINKTLQADIVTLSSAMNLSASGQDLTLTSGTLDMAGFNLDVTDVLTLESGTQICRNGGVESYTTLTNNGGTISDACNAAPTVASAIADTTVSEDSSAIDNYRDLKAVFTDAEDGSGLTYTIQSNTNSGLVTASIIPADSTLDLSFTASTTGTATITIRATDSGSSFVDDVFTVTVADQTAPAAVTLATGTVTASSVDLSWTAPGDDASTGTATTYDVRYSTSSIITGGDWDAASLASGEPSPQVAGSSESFTVTGLSSGTIYYFAIKTSDEIPNESAISNVPSAATSAAGINWGRDVQNASNATSGHSRSMGGTSPNTDGMLIDTISMYLGAQTGDVRLAVYTGGTEGDPSSATLLWDAGTVNPMGTAGWYSIGHPSGGVAWPKNTVTWLAGKRDTGVAVYYSNSTADAGDFQTARGRNANGFSADPGVAYPGTYGATGTFSGAWYSIYVVHKIEGTPPAAVTDLATGTVTASSVQLSWIAPGDDGATGTATTYDVRYSTSPIITGGDWDAASLASGEPPPQVAGSSESFTVTGLSASTTYYFAIKTSDEVPNESAISNVPSAVTSAPDATAPDDVTNLATGAVTGSSVQLSWTAPGDDGATGTATTYDVRYSESTITEGNWDSASPASGEPSPQVAGSSESFTVTGLSTNTTYYFAIKTSDEAPNESVISNVPNGMTSAVEGTPPDDVTNLATGTVTTSSVALSWTAPGDDGATGTATTYDVRYSTSLINEANWGSAVQASGEPSPQVAGSSESFTVTGLPSPSTTYYFAIKTSDEVPNESAISNVPSGTTSAASASSNLENVATAVNVGSVTSYTLNFGWTATAGRLLVLTASWDKDVTSLQEVTGGTTTWTQIDYRLSGTSTTGAMYYKVAEGTETSVRLQWSNSEDISIRVGEYSGVVSVDPFDVKSSGVTSGEVTTVSTGTTVATAQNDELAIAMMGSDSGTKTETGNSWSNGFTQVTYLTSGTADPGLSVAEKDLTAIGTVETTFTTTDSGDNMVAIVGTFKLDVGGGGNNTPAVAVAIADTTVIEDSAPIDNYRDLKAVFADVEDGSGLTYTIQSNTNSGLVTPTIVAADSTLDLSFTASTSGTATITVRATDSGALFVDDVFIVTVDPGNTTPTVASAIADTTVAMDNAPIDNYRDLKAVFTDVEDGSALTYAIQSNTNSGLVTPTIVAADSTLDLSFTASTSGTATITIRATDSGASFVDDVFTVTVDGPPTVAAAIADTTVSRDASPIDNYRDLKAVFTDVVDGSALTYTIESNTNSGLVTPTIVAADSTLDLSFTASTSGTATITVRATDSGALFVDDVFTVTVNATPTVASAIPDTTVVEDNAPIDNYRDLKAVFTDAEDGSGLTYSIQSNTNSGLVTPTIVAADSTLDLSFTASTTGTATITVRATDSGALFVDDVFTVMVGDQVPPNAIANLGAGGASTSSVQLTWTAPGDDGATGTATTYDVRYSTSPIITGGDWDAASLASGEPSPQVAGSSESFTVTPLSASTTYYFAIKTSDEVPNESAISNVISVATAASAGSSFDNSTGSNTASFSHTIGGGSDRILLYSFASETAGTGDVTNVTYNGVALTYSTYTVTASEARVEFWYMLEADLPVAGTYTVAATIAGSATTFVHGASSWSGVHQTTPFGTIVTNTGSNSTPTVTVNSATDEIVHDFVASKDASGLTADGSQSQRWSLNAAGNADVRGGGSSEAGDTNVVMSWSSAGAVDWAIIGVPMKPSGGGGNTAPTVASAIADTTVYQDDAPIDNYRDLKAVFTDTEDGSALTYTILSNTNSGLVTPTIVAADSTLDLSFTASTSGTATITVRATDSGGLTVDDVFTVTVDSGNTTPTVASAIADTTVAVDNAPIDNYRDLKAVFTDVEDGSALTYTIQSNTNSGLVTPTIVAADSTLDLSFTASTSGTATITIRATDSGASFVDDVFTVTVADQTAPDAVANLATGTVTSSSVQLSWTAPGDDASTGTATTYDVRYSTSPIITGGDWDAASLASGEPSPQIASSSESFTVTGLLASTLYYFAIKTSDEASNESAVSNVPTGTTTSGGSPTFQQGDGKANGASDTDDARLMGALATTNYGSLDRLDVDTGPPDEHSVIKFPNLFGGGVDQIPLGSSITSATLTLEVNNPGDDMLVYQLVESWDEATVTWNEASTGVSWTDAGADGTGSRKATAVGTMSASPAGSYGVDVTASVQNWSFGELNEGWLLKDTGGDGVDIRSSEYATPGVRPMLTVTWSGNTTPIVAAAIADTTVNQDNAPIDNYRDLKAVFTDGEEGSALTYSIESNTNSGLVTPTIVAADSTLDLSFTASTSGTTTITMRATDTGGLFVDDVFTVTVNGPPTVASAIADTTVYENNAAIDNCRDLKAVFTDAEDGSALTYTIESNTNVGLVTPTIVAADSTLDLSFTASTTGNATITIRATDSGGLTVDDVFTVAVNASAVLLGQYWFNEAPSGQAVATVLDDQASPVNLTVISDTLEWRLDAGHRGLGVPVAGRTNNLQHAGIVSAPVEGTKYKTNLNGATAATFVVVAEWEGGWSDRMAGFQRPGGGRILLALTDAGGGLEFRTDSDLSNPRMLWPSQGWDDGVRRVFHFVYDTDHPTDSLRMRLYVDGVDQGIPPSILDGIPPIGDGLNWGFTDIELIALNEPDFTNGFPGTVFYMGVYDGVMTDAEITSDVTALLADDDNNITYAVDVTLNGVDSLPKLPSNGTSYPYKYTVTNNSTVLEDFDLFGYPGDTLATFLTVDSIIGPNVTGGATADSARITGVPASGVDSAFVWFSVANTAAGALDSLYLNSRSISDTTVSDPGWAFVEVVKPNMTMVKGVSPSGTVLPGTELTYTVTITNDGSDDATGVVVVDSLPVELDFKVSSVVNNLPSGVTATVEYSNDGTSTWTYTPVSAGCGAPANFDSCVTHIRWTLNNDLSYVGPDNSGNVQFVTRIQ